jgi:hypothetical protein
VRRVVGATAGHSWLVPCCRTAHPERRQGGSPMPQTDEEGVYIAPQLRLAERTLVYDKERDLHVMWIQGVVVLPVGATIELCNPHVNAEVIGVRLLPGSTSHPVGVCLDVKVPQEYWQGG